VQKIMEVETSSLAALTFDGNDLWISDTTEKTIKKVSIAEQQVLKEIKFLPGGIPRAMTFANDSLVVANFDPLVGESSELIQMNVMNGKTLRTLTCPEDLNSGIVFDNTYFWGSSYEKKELYKFHPFSGETDLVISMEFPVCGLAWNGEHLIVGLDKDPEKNSTTIAILDIETQKILGETDVEAKIGGLAFAENMIFFTNVEKKEIHVTRIKMN
jgi:hypothetical protein